MALRRAVLIASRRCGVSSLQGASAWPDALLHDEDQQEQAASQPSAWQAHPASPSPLLAQGCWHTSPQLPYATRGMAFWSRKPPAPPPPTTPSELQFQDTPADLQKPPTDLPVIDAQETAAQAMQEAAVSIQAACSQVEASAIQAAQEESVLFGSQFISGLQLAHDQLGLPWWTSIALVNVVTRTVALPIMLAHQKSTSRMMALNVDLIPMRKLQEAMKAAPTQQLQAHIHRVTIQQSEELRAKHGAAISGIMGTMFLTLALNSVIFISIFNGVNNLMMMKAPSLTTGGMLWFTDLTLPDPYYGLPVLCSLTTLAMVQYGMNVTGEQLQSPEKAEQAAKLKNIFRFLALLFIPLGGYVPSGVAILWASNSAFSVFLGIALRQDAVRAAAGLPTLKAMAALGDRLQTLNAADPMSFVPPMPPSPPGYGTAAVPQQAAPAPPAGYGTTVPQQAVPAPPAGYGTTVPQQAAPAPPAGYGTAVSQQAVPASPAASGTTVPQQVAPAPPSPKLDATAPQQAVPVPPLPDYLQQALHEAEPQVYAPPPPAPAPAASPAVPAPPGPGDKPASM